MAKKSKALRVIDQIKQGYHSLLGKGLSNAINQKAISAVGSVPTFKKGGKVKRTGRIYAHKGEIVLSVSHVKALKKLLH